MKKKQTYILFDFGFPNDATLTPNKTVGSPVHSPTLLLGNGLSLNSGIHQLEGPLMSTILDAVREKLSVNHGYLVSISGRSISRPV